MSVEKSIMQNLQKNQVTIKSKSTESVSFNGANPNYYKITNGGQDNVYLGVSMTPTKKFYDMCIPSGSSKLFVDAYGHDHVYILNPSMEDAPLIITSFSAPFEPSVLALSEIGTDFSDIVINSNTLITGFEAPLPHGDNVIGRVNPGEELQVELSKLYTANNGAYTQLKSIVDYLRHTVENSNDISIVDYVSDVKLLLEGIKTNQENYSGGGSGDSSALIATQKRIMRDSITGEEIETDTISKLFDIEQALKNLTFKTNEIETNMSTIFQNEELTVAQLLGAIRNMMGIMNTNMTKMDMREYGLLYECLYEIESHLSLIAHKISGGTSQVFELVRSDSTEKTINAPEGCYVSSIVDTESSISSLYIYKDETNYVSFTSQEGSVEDMNIALKAYKPTKIRVIYRGRGTTVYTCESV